MILFWPAFENVCWIDTYLFIFLTTVLPYPCKLHNRGRNTSLFWHLCSKRVTRLIISCHHWSSMPMNYWPGMLITRDGLIMCTPRTSTSTHQYPLLVLDNAIEYCACDENVFYLIKYCSKTLLPAGTTWVPLIYNIATPVDMTTLWRHCHKEHSPLFMKYFFFM